VYNGSKWFKVVYSALVVIKTNFIVLFIVEECGGDFL